MFAPKINCHFSLPTFDLWHLTPGHLGQRSAIFELVAKYSCQSCIFPWTWRKKKSYLFFIYVWRVSSKCKGNPHVFFTPTVIAKNIVIMSCVHFPRKTRKCWSSTIQIKISFWRWLHEDSKLKHILLSYLTSAQDFCFVYIFTTINRLLSQGH